MKVKFFCKFLAILLMISIIPFTLYKANECSNKDFSKIFFEDYYPGTVWVKTGEKRTITWSASVQRVGDSSVVRPFSETEKSSIREAISSWDNATDAIDFLETNNESAEIVIGWVALNDRPSTLWGYWYAWWDSNKIRYRATIKLREGAHFYSTKAGIIHAVQHEIGNVLGLGDLKPTSEFVSVLEDPWQMPSGSLILSDFDYELIRQLHGESTCHTSWKVQGSPSPTPPA